MSPGVVLAIIAIAVLALYDVIGIYFLVKDYGVVHGCASSNRDVHIIWPTSLWSYVLASLVFITGFTFALAAMPMKKSVDAARKNFSAKGRRINSAKYGLMPTLPDWLFLWIGTAFLAGATVAMVFAFWGYSELFMARPWCKDTKTAFEELDLWHFGRVNFILQIVAGSILFLWGIVYWAAPFCLELSVVPSDPLVSGGETPLASSGRGSPGLTP